VSSLRVALRLARRDAWRSKGRSSLVVAMIALPVLGVTATDVLHRSFQLSPDQSATRRMGSADAILSDSGQQSVRQLPTIDGVAWDGVVPGGEQARTGPVPSYRSMVPAGSRLLVESADYSPSTVSAGGSTSSVSATAIDLDDPMTQGLYVDRHGRAARDAHEVVVTGGLLRRLGLHLGQQVQVTSSLGAQTRTVVGSVEVPSSLDERSVLLPAGSFPRPTRALVDVPGELTWSDVQRANARGFLLQPRGHVPGEPPVPPQVQEAIAAATLTAITLVVGMALLEVVLLAGPAFAVGAKRRTRDLALLTASGGERRDVRRTVLGGGVVIGLVGGLVGVAGGLLVTRLALHRLERVNGSLIGSFDIRPLELLMVAVVGVLTAVLAAIIPARVAARQDVVAGLTGRRGTVRSLKRVPVLGVIAAGAGALIAVDGARRRNVNLILAGSAMAELGLVATTPFLVGQAGRLARFLPLGPRLALRDAARNRGRTAPAVSAILAAVAGSIAISMVVASFDERDRDAYSPQAPKGTTWVMLDGEREAKTSQVLDAMHRYLPRAKVQLVRGVGMTESTVPTPSLAAYADLEIPGGCDGAPVASAAGETYSCAIGTTGSGPFGGSMSVGDVATVRALTGLDEAALGDVRAVLARGGAVVPSEALRPDGTAVIQVHTAADSGPDRIRRVVVPAVTTPVVGFQPAVLSKEAATKAGVATHLLGAVASAAKPPTAQEEDRMRGALRTLDLEGLMFVERGYRSEYGMGLLALMLGSAVIVLGASGIATGLAAADGRADLATLAAVGASPRTRRSLAAAQSAATAGLGTLLGAVAGLVPAVAILRALTRTVGFEDGHVVKQQVLPLVFPWSSFAVTLVVVPVLAALAAAALTRSRLPMVRRLG
jgi:putative ABC transport system permease protein